MEKNFWHNKWDEKNIGFHQSEYNQTMVNYYKDKDLSDKIVFIPLAGKSKDILFFLEKGAKVVAIELSPIACEEFFLENKEHPKLQNMTKDNDGNLFLYKNDNISFYQGDIFELTKTQTGNIDYYYDRACIVALPVELRIKYYKKIESILSSRVDLLILTYKHDGPADFGPPFYVPESELENAYKDMGFNLSHEFYATNKAQGRFKESGLTKLIQIKWNKQL